MASCLDGLSVLVTGGSGSFGHAFTQAALATNLRRLAIFSRDELKQHDMARRFPDPRMRWLLGDVRDRDRLALAFRGVDLVIHAAALKHVPACEYNPFEAKRTNVDGAENVCRAAIDAGVRKVVALSTDKAAAPVNLYGASKKMLEHLVVASNHYAAGTQTRLCCTRYGNVAWSRGSVLPVWQDQRAQGQPLGLTDPGMTRFHMSLGDAVGLVLHAIEHMRGGEIFVPKLRAARLVDLAVAFDPLADHRITGIRPGEKIHECLITADELPRTRDAGPVYVIYPSVAEFATERQGEPVPTEFTYTSDTVQRLQVHEIELRRPE